ncbi:heavy metal sensor histidine kinase [Comamonas antarctica]|uniref:Sensor protein n=1 Tax=Comamonas antarctica TaxID=2743470 RepID=A0A6N1WZL3_9BURK|nr:heavy metal sensor histidine kinase [Comamonas antarctica]QKV52138.1 heavy metal sensor histidine kinase [Comamonas antarctica]
MRKLQQISLRLRLASMFAAVSAVLFGAMGFYAYDALKTELKQRDDEALVARIERMRILSADPEYVETLRKHPHLYASTLGNKENILWITNDRGELLVEINPTGLQRPAFPPAGAPMLFDNRHDHARLAWAHVECPPGTLHVITGTLLNTRLQMLAAYRANLGFAWLAGVLLAFALGGEVVRRGLLPLRRLSLQAAAIHPQQLGLRLDARQQPQELQGLTNALNLMLARLEEGYSRLSRFSEDLAHEMRTPLNNLMGHNQQMLNQPRSVEDYENLLVSKQEEYERLARMIDNMLFLARAEKPEAMLQLKPLDLALLGGRVCDYFEGMAEESGMRMRNLAQGTLVADSALLARALANLVSNALRYGAAGSTVTLRSQPHAQGLDLEVINQGEAIGAEHLPRLFDRFYRCDPARAQPGDSGGLGLAIVQSIMHMHKGEVLVDSRPGETRFILRFGAESMASGVA